MKYNSSSVCQICGIHFIVGAGSKGLACSRQCKDLFLKTERQIRCCSTITKQELTAASLEKHNKAAMKYKKSCPHCGTTIFINKKFCSQMCSAAFNNPRRGPMTSATKNKISTKNKTNNKNVKRISYISWCNYCGKYMINSTKKSCSDTCRTELFRNSGKRLAANLQTRSKCEIQLFNLCGAFFENVSHNVQLVNGWDADIILNNHRVAILWNGPRHYKEISGLNHSLLQVQNRDKIKTKELSNAGWKVLSFEDRHYTPESAFEAIKLEVSEGVEPIVCRV